MGIFWLAIKLERAKYYVRYNICRLSLRFFFKTQFFDKKILFYTDNKASVSILKNKSSISLSVMELVRPLVLFIVLFIVLYIYFKACQIAGYKNAIADSISRKR